MLPTSFTSPAQTTSYSTVPRGGCALHSRWVLLHPCRLILRYPTLLYRPRITSPLGACTISQSVRNALFHLISMFSLSEGNNTIDRVPRLVYYLSEGKVVICRLSVKKFPCHARSDIWFSSAPAVENSTGTNFRLAIDQSGEFQSILLLHIENLKRMSTFF